MTAESSEQTTFIHSLVTLSISDQWTRARVQNGIQNVAGACLGKQSGRSIEIINTFEVKSTSNEAGLMTLNEEFFNGRAELFKETFPDLEFLGFYITGRHTETDIQDISIQKQAMKFSESPFLLKFDTATPVISDKLSLSVFESVINPSKESELIFHSIPVKIVSELSEQIGLDHVARFSNTGNITESTVSKYLSAQFGAMSTLLQGVSAAHSYVTAVKEKKVGEDETLLKDINKLCQKFCEIKSSSLVEKETKLLYKLSGAKMTAIGVPIKILHEAEGHIITVETAIGEVYRGKLIEAEDNMNCQISDVTVTLRDGRTHTLDNVFIRGSSLRFVILPDMLKNAPMFKNIGRAQKGAHGMGLGGIQPIPGLRGRGSAFRGGVRGRGGAIRSRGGPGGVFRG